MSRLSGPTRRAAPAAARPPAGRPAARRRRRRQRPDRPRAGAGADRCRMPPSSRRTGPSPATWRPSAGSGSRLQDRRPRRCCAACSRPPRCSTRFLDEELARHGLDARRLALVGFSQGTMTVAARGAAPRAGRCAAVLGFSGALLGADALRGRGASAAAGAPGPRRGRRGRAGRRAFRRGRRAAGGRHPGALSIRPGLPHAIDPEGIAHGGAFLAAAFGDG